MIFDDFDFGLRRKYFLLHKILVGMRIAKLYDISIIYM